MASPSAHPKIIGQYMRVNRAGQLSVSVLRLRFSIWNPGLDPRSGKTLLEIAVITGRPNSINQIMKLKPDLLNSVGFCGLNLVHLAVVWEQKDSIEALYNAGANISDPDENGLTAKDIAIQHGKDHFALFLDEFSKHKI